MRYAIFSDIHSNLEAFQAVLAACETEQVDATFCAGDIVGYGADPVACLNLIKDKEIHAVAGNHDWAISGLFSRDFFVSYGKEALLWTHDQLTSDQINFLNCLDLIRKNKDFLLVHGTLDYPRLFHYLFDIPNANNTFNLLDRQVCFVGHTHVPRIFIQEGDQFSYSMDLQITLKPEHHYIINVGSVGQPRDDIPFAAYCIFDTEAKTIEIKRVPYDIETAQKKILKAGLPENLAQRLSAGQ